MKLGVEMETINKRYIVDEQNKKIAVQIPIDTFEKIEEILENYALVQLMKKNENEEVIGVSEAKSYYDQLEKAP
jgi:type III secretory pathway component EscV